MVCTLLIGLVLLLTLNIYFQQQRIKHLNEIIESYRKDIKDIHIILDEFIKNPYH